MTLIDGPNPDRMEPMPPPKMAQGSWGPVVPHFGGPAIRLRLTRSFATPPHGGRGLSVRNHRAGVWYGRRKWSATNPPIFQRDFRPSLASTRSNYTFTLGPCEMWRA